MKFWVYVLISQTSGRFYIGHTSNLQDRIKRHNNNRVPSTKFKGPWSVLYSRHFDSRNDAMERERKLKNLKSRKNLLLWIHKHLDDRSFTGPEFFQIFDLYSKFEGPRKDSKS